MNLTDASVKALPAPASGNRITYDDRVKGFGVRITKAGTRAFIVNYRTKHGRERRYTIGTFPDWKTTAARSEAVDIKKRVDRGDDPVGEIRAGRNAPTVADLCDRFEAEHLPRKRPSTQAAYKGQIDREIRPALGRLKVGEVTFADIDGLHRKITKRGKPYRANRVIALLSKMFSLAIRWRLRPDNPVKGIERNDELRRRRYLSADELGRLTAALAAHRDQQGANIVRLLLLTGARRGEVLSARWDQIDLEAGAWNKLATGTKQKLDHSVPLSDAARQLLTELRDGRGQVDHVNGDDSEFVFPGRDGRHRSDVQNAWETLCKAADIKGARLHDLRHTYASILASAGLSLPVIGALLGHQTPTTTARYSHLFSDPLRAATERAAAILSGKPSAEVVRLRHA